MPERSRSPAQAGSPLSLRLQIALALVPLPLYAAYHVWLQWPALESRDAWSARVSAHALPTWLSVVVLGVFILQALLGLTSLLRESRLPPERVRLARWQAITGLLVLGFLIFHLRHVWPAPSGLDATWIQAYQLLWQRLGQPLALAMYVIGSAALACHIAYAWGLACEPQLPAARRSGFRYLAGLAGLLLFALYIQVVGRFALGEAVVPMWSPPHEVAPAREVGQL
jgi:hypothetical protein